MKEGDKWHLCPSTGYSGAKQLKQVTVGMLAILRIWVEGKMIYQCLFLEVMTFRGLDR